jgi:hypothetical protein
MILVQFKGEPLTMIHVPPQITNLIIVHATSITFLSFAILGYCTQYDTVKITAREKPLLKSRRVKQFLT